MWILAELQRFGNGTLTTHGPRVFPTARDILVAGDSRKNVTAGVAQSLVRKATVSDATGIQKLIRGFADRNEMLHRSMNELFETIRDFQVVEEGGEIIAVAAVHVTWDDLAELKCVAVSPEHQGRGLGKAVVQRCLDDAAALGVRRVFALTYKPEFFAKFGFRIVDRNTLPHKVWGECIKCHKYPNCNEIAMMCHLATNTNSTTAHGTP